MNGQQYILGEEARIHIRTLLGRGNTFSQIVLSEVPLDKGTVKAIFVSVVDEKGLNEFEYGGKLPEQGEVLRLQGAIVPVPNSDSRFVSIVQEFLHVNSLHMCLCENSLAQLRDPVLVKHKSRTYSFNQEIYSVLLSTDHQEDVILQARKESHTFPQFIAALIDMPKPLFVSEQTRGVFTRDMLVTLAHNVKSLIVSAYDGEGYLVWDING